MRLLANLLRHGGWRGRREAVVVAAKAAAGRQPDGAETIVNHALPASSMLTASHLREVECEVQIVPRQENFSRSTSS